MFVEDNRDGPDPGGVVCAIGVRGRWSARATNISPLRGLLAFNDHVVGTPTEVWVLMWKPLAESLFGASDGLTAFS